MYVIWFDDVLDGNKLSFHMEQSELNYHLQFLSKIAFSAQM